MPQEQCYAIIHSTNWLSAIQQVQMQDAFWLANKEFHNRVQAPLAQCSTGNCYPVTCPITQV